MLAGRVSCLMSGYEFSGDRVDLSMRLYDVRNASSVRYIQQTADKPIDYPDNSFLHRLRTV